ncbi:hypothetical protein BDR03DRAFT_857502 [Suillus americanus]|nr:hypothetical protein BDR03DRAFT_857502 [Suillus americanus]
MISVLIISERIMKDWISLVYAFFNPTPCIVTIEGRLAHEFMCLGKSCKATVRRYLNKKDARSTGNMRKHVRACWGKDILVAADNAKDANEARVKIVGGFLRNGSITALFEPKGKGQVTYSHRQHTRAETRAEIVKWVAESLCPFEIVKDQGFQSLMKTGRPEYYLPLPNTISRDVRVVFVRTHERIAKMIKEYAGKLNFTMDGWTATNHRAFIAFLVHLEHNGVLLTFPLDIIGVPKV